MPEQTTTSTHDVAVAKLKQIFDRRRSLVCAELYGIGVEVAVLANRNLWAWLGYTADLGLYRDGRLKPMSKAELADAVGGQKGSFGYEESCSIGLLSSIGVLDGRSLVNISSAIREARMLKDALDLAVLERAAQITAAALARAVNVTEHPLPGYQVIQNIESSLWQLGWEGVWSFDPSLASGPALSCHWAAPTNAAVRKGDMLTVDMGIRFKGMCSDVARTWVMGGAVEADPESVSVLARVEELLELVAARMRSGVRCGDLVSIADSTARTLGLELDRTIALGHGIGVEVHEPPFLVPEGKDVMTPGTVVCLEPCAMTRDGRRIRVEAMYAVTDGCPSRLDEVPLD